MEQINRLESEISELRQILSQKEDELHHLKNKWFSYSSAKGVESNTMIMSQSSINQTNGQSKGHGELLPKWAIERYSRQILLADIGAAGQARLCAARVLVVGAGGLGCPATVYLAGAGVGEIGIVDYDTVDLTNIHRQFLHREQDQNISKAESAANALRSINSRIKVTPYSVQLDSLNALEIAAKYDLVLDCTDNVPTRYLLNDLCVIAKLPLISGSALKMEGQLTIYGYRDDKNPSEEPYRGPCYRCVFPSPPPADSVGSCSANGVAGPVPGTIGALQALEAIKYIVGQTHSQLLVERLLLFDGEDMTFRTVKLRPRNPQCAVCSNSPTITRLVDYEAFCKTQAKEKKKQESRLNSERRVQEKIKRMTGECYYGFRQTADGEKKWVQDVAKRGRALGPPCACRGCPRFSEADRLDIFTHFWKRLDWREKREYVRSLIDKVPAKRRRATTKGAASRKGVTRKYHLYRGGARVGVCRGMLLRTLGVKEASVRQWLDNDDRPKATKRPIKSLNVDAFIDNLSKSPPKCQHCLIDGAVTQYVDVANVKNVFQLYNVYVNEMKSNNVSPASRKTFCKVVSSRNIRVFKPKNDGDVCDVNSQHNRLLFADKNDQYYYESGDVFVM